MKIIFTLTKQDAWRHYKYDLWRAFKREPFPYVVAWIISFTVLWLILAVLWHLGEKDFLLCLAMSFVTCFSGTLASALSTRQRYFKRIAKNSSWIGDCSVEIGKFDLRWGSPESEGYYYHWSAFSEVIEDNMYLYLILPKKGALIIPRSAFSGDAEAQAFATEVRSRWETMKQRQRYLEQENVGAWPPPPRLEI